MTRRRFTFSLFLICLTSLLTPAALHAQTALAPSLRPGPKPTDAPLEWKQLVGIYSHDKQIVILLERDQRLYWRESDTRIERIEEKNGLLSLPGAAGRGFGLITKRDTDGSATTISHINQVWTRADAGSDATHFFHVTPTRPVAELRATALAAKPPEEAGPYRKPDLVELAALDPTFRLDIRYAQSNNFLSTPVYTEARAFLQRPAAEALLQVLNRLRPLGYGLLIHDAYRPWYVTKIFWDATPRKDHRFVADPKKGSKHNRGCAVDITLYDLANSRSIEMPGLYDEMSQRSFPTFPGGTSLQRWHRDLLRRAMESQGFAVSEDEWWHFDYTEWKYYAILNVPFEKLGAPAPLTSAQD
jgi:D-alanyl-D-alanine dipeptidase